MEKVEKEEKKSGKGKKAKKNTEADNVKPAAEVSPKQDKKGAIETVVEKNVAEVTPKVEVNESVEAEKIEDKGVIAFDELGGMIKYINKQCLFRNFHNCSL